MTDQGQIVPASHADSLRLTRPDGTALQIPVKCVLAIDRVLRRSLHTREEFQLSWVDALGCGCWASLRLKDHESNNAGVGGTPWAAVLALAQKLKENTKP